MCYSPCRLQSDSLLRIAARDNDVEPLCCHTRIARGDLRALSLCVGVAVGTQHAPAYTSQGSIDLT